MIKTYMPVVANEKSMARQLFDLIRRSPYQKRKEIRWNETLAQVATAHCQDMADRGYFGHVNPEGMGANQRVRNAGYRLPDLYDSRRDANNIESLAAGDPSVEGTRNAWLNSKGHRPHVFGENEFYAGQTQMGVGHVYKAGTKYRWYWCVLCVHDASG